MLVLCICEDWSSYTFFWGGCLGLNITCWPRGWPWLGLAKWVRDCTQTPHLINRRGLQCGPWPIDVADRASGPGFGANALCVLTILAGEI